MERGASKTMDWRIRRFAILAGLVLVLGCAGPPALQRAILPQHQHEYVNAMAFDRANPKNAFLNWKAHEMSVSLAEARERDVALGDTRNPFDANHDRLAVSRGAVVYAEHCARCHGADVDGKGDDVLPTNPCKNFHAFDKRFAVTLHRGAPRSWFKKIRDGHGAIAQYPTGPSTAMPAFGELLSNEQIWLAITYLQSLDVYVPPPPAEAG